MCAITVDVNLHHQTEELFVGFLHNKLTLFFSLPILCSLEGNHWYGPLLSKGISASILWGQTIYIKYLEFLCRADLSLLPHSFIYLIIY